MRDNYYSISWESKKVDCSCRVDYMMFRELHKQFTVIIVRYDTYHAQWLCKHCKTFACTRNASARNLEAMSGILTSSPMGWRQTGLWPLNSPSRSFSLGLLQSDSFQSNQTKPHQTKSSTDATVHWWRELWAKGTKSCGGEEGKVMRLVSLDESSWVEREREQWLISWSLAGS